MNIYQENGYENRQEYLECLAEDYGQPIVAVMAVAGILGEDEDFDGLINALEDMEDGI